MKWHHGPLCHQSLDRALTSRCCHVPLRALLIMRNGMDATDVIFSRWWIMPSMPLGVCAVAEAIGGTHEQCVSRSALLQLLEPPHEAATRPTRAQTRNQTRAQRDTPVVPSHQCDASSRNRSRSGSASRCWLAAAPRWRNASSARRLSWVSPQSGTPRATASVSRSAAAGSPPTQTSSGGKLKRPSTKRREKAKRQAKRPS